jgi:hypothetical protein
MRRFYRSRFVQTKGVLNHELTAYLRTRRVMRRPGGANRFKATTMGQIADMVSIRERPAEAADRAVPGALGGRSDLWHGRLRGGHVGGALDPVDPAGAYREDHLRNTSPPRSAATSSRCPNRCDVR